MTTAEVIVGAVVCARQLLLLLLLCTELASCL